MPPVQQASLFFTLPIAASYFFAAGGWLLITRWRPSLRPAPILLQSNHRYLDFGLSAVAVLLILFFGQLYRMGWLLSTKGNSWLHELAWLIDNLIIYSPIFLILALRRHSTQTIFLSGEAWPKKVALGLGLGIPSVLLFLGLRGELSQFGSILAGAIQFRRLVNFVPVFLEGIAVAFLFVRLRWIIGIWLAILVPALLFGLAHIPGQLQEGYSLWAIGIFLLLNTGVVTAVLYVVQYSQDILWIGLVHYLLDIAIQAI